MKSHVVFLLYVLSNFNHFKLGVVFRLALDELSESVYFSKGINIAFFDWFLSIKNKVVVCVYFFKCL